MRSAHNLICILLSLASDIKTLREATHRLVEASEMNMNYLKRSSPILFKILQQVRCKDAILYELLVTEGITRANAFQFLGAIDEGITELRQIECAVNEVLSGDVKLDTKPGHSHRNRTGLHEQDRRDNAKKFTDRQHEPLSPTRHNQQKESEQKGVETKGNEKARSPHRGSLATVSAARTSSHMKKELRRLDSILPSMTSSSIDEDDDDGSIRTPYSTQYLRKHAAEDQGAIEDSKKRMAALRHMRDVIEGRKS